MATSAFSNANLGSPDSISFQSRPRHHATEAIAQAAIERRVAEAANAKPQQYSLETLKLIVESDAKAERWREPPRNDHSEWPGRDGQAHKQG
eukprot:6441640-Pyramimonas_sp.AAC.1